MIDHMGWQAVFLMCLPFCMLAWFGAIRYLALPGPRSHSDFDWVGMGALSLMTLALLACASSFGSAQHAALLVIGYAVLALMSLIWFLRHARNPDAIVTHEVLRWRPVAMGMVVSFVYGFGVYGSSYLIPVFMQTVLGLSATQSGGVLLPGGLVLAVTLPLAGLLADRLPPYLIVMAGLVLFCASSAAMWFCAMTISYTGLVWLTILGRIGIGFLIAALNQAALRGLQGRLLGQSAMVVSYARMLGGFLGVAMLAVYVQWRGTVLGATPAAVGQAFCESFLISALVFVLAMVPAWRMKPNA